MIVANVDAPARRAVLIRLGPLLVVLGLLGLVLALTVDAPWVVLPSQVVIGSGFGVSWAFLSQAVMEAARPGERDRASAMLPTVLSAGYAIGAALAGLVANAAGMREALETGLVADPARWAFSVAAGLGLLAVLASLRMVPWGPRA